MTHNYRKYNGSSCAVVAMVLAGKFLNEICKVGVNLSQWNHHKVAQFGARVRQCQLRGVDHGVPIGNDVDVDHAVGIRAVGFAVALTSESLFYCLHRVQELECINVSVEADADIQISIWRAVAPWLRLDDARLAEVGIRI